MFDIGASQGTKYLFKILPEIFETLKVGGTILLDELPNLHPEIIKGLLRFIKNNSSEQRNTQVIFVTHMSEVLEDANKYEIIITEPTNEGTIIYNIQDVEQITADYIRPTQNLGKLYRENRIGGRPDILDNLFFVD